MFTCLSANKRWRPDIALALMIALTCNTPGSLYAADEAPAPSARDVQSRKFPKPISEVVATIQERMEASGGKCYITVSYYPEGEGNHTGVGSCKFEVSDKPTMLDKVAKGANFIPLVGSLVAMGVSATSDAIKDKEKESFVSIIRFEAIGSAKAETQVRMRAFTGKQKQVSEDRYYKELFERLADAMLCTASELSLNEIEQ